MNRTRTRRLHAARVATSATAVVMVFYVLGAISLNALVTHRLTAQADTRLNERLLEGVRPSLHVKGGPAPADADHDIDDAPRFEWAVSGTSAVTALTPGAPVLPHRAWREGATTLPLGATPFRFDAIRTRGGGVLVAGESLAQLNRVRSALGGPELALGLILLVLTFGGSLLIGLRASAPLELIHRRQVEFTADASHELRTPLSVIEAEVELALSRPRRPEEYEAVVHRIAGEGHRLRNIVDDLLWLARIDDERRSGVHDQEADVAAVARSSVERFRPLAATREVEMRMDAAGVEPGMVRADPRWIDRLIGVLVDNACKFAGPGGRVEVAVRSMGSRVVLRVDDSGPGIPVEDRPLVFDRFHRSADEPSGSGLGLAIADSVVSATKGSWHVGDSPGGGARMQVSWKRVPVTPTPPDGGRRPDGGEAVPPDPAGLPDLSAGQRQ